MELLGKGTYGSVFVTEKNGINYANKQIQIKNIISYNLLFEIDFVCRLNHPNLIHAHIVEIKNNIINLYFDLGIDLYKYLKKIYISPSNKYLNVLKILNDIGQAISYLHNLPIPCYHSDIKQQNVIVYDDGKYAKLIDFSLSGTIKNKGEFGGTLGYSSPETYIGNEKNYFKSDIWSYGILILTSLTGHYLINLDINESQIEYTKHICELCLSNENLKQKLQNILIKPIHIIELYINKQLPESYFDINLIENMEKLYNKYNEKYLNYDINKKNIKIIYDIIDDEIYDEIVDDLINIKNKLFEESYNILPINIYHLLLSIFNINPNERPTMNEILKSSIWDNNINNEIIIYKTDFILNNYNFKNTNIIGNIIENINDNYKTTSLDIFKNILNTLEIKLASTYMRFTVEHFLIATNYFYKSYNYVIKNYATHYIYDLMISCMYISYLILKTKPTDVLDYKTYAKLFDINSTILLSMVEIIIFSTNGNLFDIKLLNICPNTEENYISLILKLIYNNHYYEYLTYDEKYLNLEYNDIKGYPLINIYYYLYDNTIHYITPDELKQKINNFNITKIYEWIIELCFKCNNGNILLIPTVFLYLDWVLFNYFDYFKKKGLINLIYIMCYIYVYDNIKYININIIRENTLISLENILDNYSFISNIFSKYKTCELEIYNNILKKYNMNKNDIYKYMIIFHATNTKNILIDDIELYEYITNIQIDSSMVYLNKIKKSIKNISII